MMRKEFIKAEKWLNRDMLARALLKRCQFDEKTFKTMLFRYWSENATFEEIAKQLHIGQPGAWKRWRRGLDTIMRSFYTLELAIYAGILDAETAEMLAKDLQDYASIARGEGDLDLVRDRIEKRMLELTKRVP
jgi:hypothetical protein